MKDRIGGFGREKPRLFNRADGKLSSMYFAPIENPVRYLMANHLPVLCGEVLKIFRPRGGQSFLDATFGGGGHTRAILEADPGSRVIGLDWDPEAEKRAGILSMEYGDRFKFYGLNFRDLEKVEEEGFSGALFDLGMSSFQLEAPERGFSFRFSGPADMRMDPRRGRTAASFLEEAKEEELVRAVRDYGEEPRWRKVVKAILEARKSGELRDTKSLAALVGKAAGPTRRGRRGIHPATRTFQGIRIAINEELTNLEGGLGKAFAKLDLSGVLAVISFHSLEDRMVKRFFRRMAGKPEHAGDSLPQQCRVRKAELLTKVPIRPLESEERENPRSRSARLRALRKTATRGGETNLKMAGP